MKTVRPVIDVSGLPTEPFGPRSLIWWGTISFMVIEGFTLLLMAASYLFLRLNEYSWPPEPIPNPDLLAATVNTALILLLMVPMHLASKAAHEHDRAGVTRWLIVATALAVPTVVLRGFELAALHAHWDTNAYASAAWGLLILHGSLLAVDLVETGTLSALFLSGSAEKKHYGDVADAALYQYFLSLIWVPVYLLVFWGPRIF